uniref:Uncharacterized protein n=1 Tax=Avena sativa TaxID=4498 RepID=A0ACD5YC68_AVESA
MTRRCGISSSSPPLAALALLLILCFSHCAAAARLLPADTAPRQDTGVVSVKAAGAASEGGLAVLQTEGANVGNGAEESASEAVTAAAEEEGPEDEEEEACEEGNGGGEECMQRRLLHDAHLDYIYTQRKGRP